MSDLEKANELADLMVVNSSSDVITVNDTEMWLQQIQVPMEDVLQKLLVRKNQIHDALLRLQTVPDTMDDFYDRLSEFQESLNKEGPVSANASILLEQNKDHKVGTTFIIF